MVGYVFCLTDEEMKKTSTCGGYPYALKNKSRWKSFNFEESSIDLGIATTPRFVVDGVVYEEHHQYFIKENSSTIRLIVLHKSKADCENVKQEDLQS